MNLYVVRNPKGEWYAMDGEGYTSLLRHAAIFLVRAAAESYAANAVPGEMADEVCVLNPHAFEGKEFTMDHAIRAAWNTALLCQAMYAGTVFEDRLWLQEGT